MRHLSAIAAYCRIDFMRVNCRQFVDLRASRSVSLDSWLCLKETIVDNKTINAIGAAAVLVTGAAAGTAAAADPVPVAASYADLLQPVSDPEARLSADNAARESAPALFHEAQYARDQYDHHHHHHHHHHSRRWYYQHGYVWNGRMWVLRPVRYHHHHHHHHHQMD